MTFGHVLGTERYQASVFDYHSPPRFESDQWKCCGAGDENRTRMASLEVFHAPWAQSNRCRSGLL
jgi:hypothetical protein